MKVAVLLRLIASLAVVCAVSPTWALDIPRSAGKDQRILTTEYDPAEVIAVNTMTGIATHIELADDEIYLSHALGDAAAYDFQQINKHLLFKPVAPQADTNLVVITNRRSYSFLLRHIERTSGQEVLRVSLTYPDIDKAQAALREQAAEVDRAFSDPSLAINWESYTMSGHPSLAPVNAWDDGAQTWFRFAPGQDLPVVYFVDTDGKEVIANRHMYDDHTIVMHRVAEKWHLRLGDQVLAVYNEGKQTRSLPTRTVSPDVERVLRRGTTP